MTSSVDIGTKTKDMIQTIDQERAEHLTTILKASVELKKRDTAITILTGHVEKFLDIFEAHFDIDESRFEYEELEDYISAAKYVELRTGRKNYISRVEDVINALPC